MSEEYELSEEEKKKIEKMPDTQVVIWGFGRLLLKQDKIIELLDRRVSFLLSHIDRKMDNIIERLEKIEQKNR